MSVLVGNMLVVQTGGGTCAANASLAGAVIQAGKHPESIEEIYGALNGFAGILEGRLIDLQEEKQHTIQGLCLSPGAALGAGTLSLDFQANPELAANQTTALFNVLEANNVRYLFPIGGAHTQDLANRINTEARTRGYELRVIGIPKSATNDIPGTDHSPGYGSAVKALATTVLEAHLDTLASGEEACSIIEVSGGASGWLAAGSLVARQNADGPPHIVLVPEMPADEAPLLTRIQETVERLGTCCIVVAEGAVNTAGSPLAAAAGAGSIGDRLAALIGNEIGLSATVHRAGRSPWSAGRLASQTDLDEAFDCGRNAVLSAINGQSAFMVKLVRQGNDPYKWSIGLTQLSDVAKAGNPIPAEWLAADKLLPNEAFLHHVRPLIQGEPEVPMAGGLPAYAQLDKVAVELDAEDDESEPLPPLADEAPATA